MSVVETKTLKVSGMTCSSCELKIERVLTKMPGIHKVAASLQRSEVTVEYDPSQVNLDQIIAAITKLGYEAEGPGAQKISPIKEVNQLLGIGIIVFALYWIIKSTVGFNFIPQIDNSVGYGMLFVIGLLTSLHCVAMCGGINLSQCISAQTPGQESTWAKLKPSILYNSGRVISYTVLGGIVGAIGSAISFSGPAKGLVAVGGGVFMVIVGINMLGLFPWLKRIQVGIPKLFGLKIQESATNRGPFLVGLLNGFMPCGPLQTMQLYALATGSFWAGAAAMFLFSLGTVPLMFSFGALSSVLSSKFTHRMLKFSAILVIVLGLTMVNRGLSLSGVTFAAPGLTQSKPDNVAQIQGNVQVITTTFDNGQYKPFTVQKGIPVRWTIRVTAQDLNGCNNPVTIPQYNIQKKLVPGDNRIDFTPDKTGTIVYTCWMGMIKSTITVVPDLTKISPNDSTKSSNLIKPSNSSDSSSPAASGSTAPATLGGGSCCSSGAQAVKFQGGRIPTEDIQIAKMVDGVQEVTIKVNNEGYSPAVAVVQKGRKVKIRFIVEQLNSCNSYVVFPEYRGQLDLSQDQTSTPALNVTRDFTFQCGMGMLHGYIKAVDDINKVDLNEIKNQIANYRPAYSGGGCCGQ